MKSTESPIASHGMKPPESGRYVHFDGMADLGIDRFGYACRVILRPDGTWAAACERLGVVGVVAQASGDTTTPFVDVFASLIDGLTRGQHLAVG